MALGRAQGRQQYDGDVAGIEVGLELAGHFESGQPGHEDVADDQVGVVGAGTLQTGGTVGFGDDVEIGSELLFEELTDVVVVLDDE